MKKILYEVLQVVLWILLLLIIAGGVLTLKNFILEGIIEKNIIFIIMNIVVMSILIYWGTSVHRFIIYFGFEIKALEVGCSANDVLDYFERDVIKMVAEQAGLEFHLISEKSRFKEDLGMNELDLAEIRFSIEMKYEIKVSANFFERIKTVGELLTLILENGE